MKKYEEAELEILSFKNDVLTGSTECEGNTELDYPCTDGWCD